MKRERERERERLHREKGEDCTAECGKGEEDTAECRSVTQSEENATVCGRCCRVPQSEEDAAAL